VPSTCVLPRVCGWLGAAWASCCQTLCWPSTSLSVPCPMPACGFWLLTIWRRGWSLGAYQIGRTA